MRSEIRFATGHLLKLVFDGKTLKAGGALWSHSSLGFL